MLNRARWLFLMAALLAFPPAASADITAFLGTNPTPVNRVTTGFSVGAGLVIVGFEFEYGHTRENLEELAPSLRTYMFNGLLQTPDYTRAVLSAQLPHHSAQQIEQLVELRLRRQERLHADDPLRFTAVVDESVLLRVVGDPGVMAAQLRHLVDLVDSPHVVVRVLPFTAGPRRSHHGHFMLLEIPDDLGSDVVYIEGHAGGKFLESESDVDLYRDVFDDALARSLDAGASRDAVGNSAAHFAPPGKAPP